ncbi:MAG TPA: glycosyltransferase family 2 protein [Gemmatimonadales bacterium]|nr:glycosyltransferase family 2 protein [Gemmatimonadales bacterium]
MLSGSPGTPSAALVVVAYGGHELVVRLLDSLRRHPDAGLMAEVVLVDNGWPHQGDCRDRVDPRAYTFPIRFVQNRDRSYSSGINRGASGTSAEVIIAANSDLEWIPGSSIEPLLRVFGTNPRVGVAGPTQVYPDGTWQRSYGPLPSVPEALGSVVALEQLWSRVRRAVRGKRTFGVSYVDGAFLATRRACFEALGGFDERLGFYAEDLDYCWRAASAGWKCVVVPEAVVMHVRGSSSRSRTPMEYLVRLARAKRAFVGKRHGARSAVVYGWLLHAGAVAQAAFASLLGVVRQDFAARRKDHLDWVRATRSAATSPVDRA